MTYGLRSKFMNQFSVHSVLVAKFIFVNTNYFVLKILSNIVMLFLQAFLRDITPENIFIPHCTEDEIFP